MAIDVSVNQCNKIDIECNTNILYLCGITLKVLVATIDAQWEGMGDVGSARYEVLPPMPDHKGFNLQ